MKTLHTKSSADNQGQPWSIDLIQSKTFSDIYTASSAIVCALNKDHLLLTKHPQDGWTLPGGHLEVGESAEHAISRETYEETSCRIANLQLLGYINLTLQAAAPANYPYPYPTRTRLVYTAIVTSCDHFNPQPDAIDRALYSPIEIEELPDKFPSLIDHLTYFVPLARQVKAERSHE